MPRQFANWSPRESFEECEDRIVFSAQPLDLVPVAAALGPPDLVMHAELADPVPLVPHTVTGAGSAANPHAQTGVDYVQDTYGFTGSGQTVAIIDSGIAWDHYALGGGFGAGYRVVGGWDFAENDANPYDDGPAGFHGTHVAGIVGSSDATYAGVAPGVDLVGLRVFDDQGNGYFTWVEQALDWVHENRNAFENPITTVNLSIGANWNSNSIPQWAMLEDEFAQLEADGIVVTVSAGNSFAQYGSKGLSYPAASPYVIPVASVGASGNLSSFSQRTDRVLAAPGENIMSTVPDQVYSFDNVPNDFAIASGTSMASPYVAGASVLVRQAMEAQGHTGINSDSIYAVLRETADPVWDSITQTTYFRINVGAAIDSIMLGNGAAGGDSDPSNPPADPPPVTNWGTVAAASFVNETVQGETWYQVTAANAATFTVQANYSGSGVQIGVYDVNHNQLATSATGTQTPGVARVDLKAQAGQTFLVCLSGNSNDVDLLVANLVSQSGRVVNVSGTDGDDLFAYQAGGTHVVTAGGIEYSFTRNLVTTINFNGGAGSDTLQITGSSAAERAIVKVGSVDFSSTSYRVTGATVETIRVAGGGGADVATLYDSAGDDTLIGGGNSATLEGAGYSNSVQGFAGITAIASGGLDTAQLSDTAGNDTFSATPTSSKMVGTGYSITLSGFERVTATATTGVDRAVLYGTSGSDTLTASPTVVSLTSGNLFKEARGFDAVTIDGGGGVDIANLTGSSGQDTFKAIPGLATFTGPGFAFTLRAFETVEATGQGGGDIAVFSGSKGVDTFTARPTTANFTTGGWSFTANGFASVTGIAVSGGADRAYLYDGAGNDTLTAKPLEVTLAGAGYSNTARFANVFAYASTGFDLATFHDSRRNDVFTALPGQANMRGPGFNNTASGFDQAHGMSTRGLDLAMLSDSAGVDLLTSQNGLTTLSGTGFENSASNFRTIKVLGDAGGANQAVFEEMGSRESLSGRDNWIAATRGATKILAYDFDFVTLDAQDGANVRADVQAVDYLFEREG